MIIICLGSSVGLVSQSKDFILILCFAIYMHGLPVNSARNWIAGVGTQT